ncbi:MAG TPA: hypothetical protein VF682_20875 [Pseudomonas sp.]|jgi:hypothetical protein
MTKTKEDPVPANEPIAPQIEYPELCGTMLLYAGVIRLEAEDVESPPHTDGTDGPTFI